MKWSADEDTLLRERYGQVPTRAIAEALGRTFVATRLRAHKLVLRTPRPVSSAEVELVRRLYQGHTAKQVAARVYGDPRRWRRVASIAEAHGLTKYGHWPSDVLEGVRALHAEGLTDRLIAERMANVFAAGDDGRLQIRHIRLRLKLPAHVGSEHQIEAKRRGIATQMHTLALANPNDLRRRAHERFARRYGLPPDLKVVQVRMMLALLAGPLTLPELRAAIGARPDSALHNGAQSTYQAELVHRGLVARIPLGRNRGPRVLYILTAAALDLLAAADDKVTTPARRDLRGDKNDADAT